MGIRRIISMVYVEKQLLSGVRRRKRGGDGVNRNNRKELEEEYRANEEDLQKWLGWLCDYAENASGWAKEKDLDEAKKWLRTLQGWTKDSLALIEQMERLLVHPNRDVEVTA